VVGVFAKAGLFAMSAMNGVPRYSVCSGEEDQPAKVFMQIKSMKILT